MHQQLVQTNAFHSTRMPSAPTLQDTEFPYLPCPCIVHHVEHPLPTTGSWCFAHTRQCRKVPEIAIALLKQTDVDVQVQVTCMMQALPTSCGSSPPAVAAAAAAAGVAWAAAAAGAASAAVCISPPLPCPITPSPPCPPHLPCQCIIHHVEHPASLLHAHRVPNLVTVRHADSGSLQTAVNSSSTCLCRSWHQRGCCNADTG
jgi:hypothetical protein